MNRKILIGALLRVALVGCAVYLLTGRLLAQPAPGTPSANPATPGQQALSVAPAKVDVNPVAHDAEIQQRLQSVLAATGWFRSPQVEVTQGVVFLKGEAQSAELKKWAGDLAGNT